jgi:hypothetical protein
LVNLYATTISARARARARARATLTKVLLQGEEEQDDWSSLGPCLQLGFQLSNSEVHHSFLVLNFSSAFIFSLLAHGEIDL